MSEACPCCSSKPFAQCCEPYLKGDLEAPTPEALMRSRYTAFALQDMDYVRATTDPQTVLKMDVEASREWAESSEFVRLEVLQSSSEGNKGAVEFKAHFKTADGQTHVHHEFSKFRKQAGIWYFRDGRVVAPPPANPS